MSDTRCTNAAQEVFQSVIYTGRVRFIPQLLFVYDDADTHDRPRTVVFKTLKNVVFKTLCSKRLELELGNFEKMT